MIRLEPGSPFLENQTSTQPVSRPASNAGLLFFLSSSISDSESFSFAVFEQCFMLINVVFIPICSFLSWFKLQGRPLSYILFSKFNLHLGWWQHYRAVFWDNKLKDNTCKGSNLEERVIKRRLNTAFTERLKSALWVSMYLARKY